MPELINTDWGQIGSHLMTLILAYVLALPVAWDQEKSARGAGLRTFPLVALGSCGYVLVGLYVLEGSESHARILYGLMTGIGFIGGGAILKSSTRVHGTATAASIWNTGAIGAAVAFERYHIAVVLTLVNFAILRFVTPVKELAGKEKGTAEN